MWEWKNKTWIDDEISNKKHPGLETCNFSQKFLATPRKQGCIKLNLCICVSICSIVAPVPTAKPFFIGDMTLAKEIEYIFDAMIQENLFSNWKFSAYRGCFNFKFIPVYGFWFIVCYIIVYDLSSDVLISTK